MNQVNKETELIIYLSLTVLCAISSRILSGLDNGTFYAKGVWKETGGNKEHPNPKDLNKYITPVYKNFHRAETPIWYTTYGMLFFSMLAFFRVCNDTFFISFLSSLLITMGSSAAGNVAYQGLINVGSGLPFIDSKEKSDSEFALGNYSKWWKRPFSGKKRILSQYLGIIAIILGFILGFTNF